MRNECAGSVRAPRAIIHSRPRLRAAVSLIGLVLATRTAAATTYYVDAANSAAVDTNPGTSSAPYKTISAAVTARGTAGNKIVVRPAIYRETVTVWQSGTSSSPIVLEASGAGVVVCGADDWSGPGNWLPTSDTTYVYVAAGVTWQPQQVFVDGARLAPSTADPSALPANAFTWVSGSGLYVNLGGANPGSRALEVGRRLKGVSVWGSYVTLDGFVVRRTEDQAVGIGGGAGCVVQHCVIEQSARQGIDLENSSDALLYKNTVSDNHDHGIVLNSSPRCTLRDNESFGNARPASRAANGINLFGSPNCTVEQNRCHDNQDSGVQFYNGSNDCVSSNNRSWNNGDHGYDHLHSTGVLHVNDLAFNNYKDGFSFEGMAGGSVTNCIAVDNGLTVNEYDLYADSSSVGGLVSNYNLFWNSTAQPPVKWCGVRYASVATYSQATGQDANTIQADPKFTDAGAGDFRLLAGSPAIDDANAGVSGWPSNDAGGGVRDDDPSTPNTGAGPVAYADRGPLEYMGDSEASPNLATNPGFENDLSGWASNGGAVLARVSPGHGGQWCLEAQAPASSTYGITDSLNLITNVAAAGMSYHLSAWCRSATGRGTAKIKVREFLGGMQQGPSAYSGPAMLSPVWQQVTLDYVTRAAGSELDIEFNDYPAETGEAFEIDDISITQSDSGPVNAGVPPPHGVHGFAAALAEGPGRSRELALTTTRPGTVRVEVFDVGGRRVSEPLPQAFLAPGEHRFPVASASLAAGMYFYRVRAAEGTLAGKFVVTR